MAGIVSSKIAKTIIGIDNMINAAKMASETRRLMPNRRQKYFCPIAQLEPKVAGLSSSTP